MPAFEVASRKELFERIVRACREQGFETLYILVDNVTTYEDRCRSVEEQFERISGLVKNYSLLSMGLRGVVFKFFLPEEIAAMVDGFYRNKLHRSMTIEWDRQLLREILLQRLIVCCLDEKLKRSEFILSTFEEMFAPPLCPHIIETILEAGHRARSPRAMWQLGYYLLEEHFSYGGALRRVDELIDDGDLLAAQAASAETPAEVGEAAGSTPVPIAARKTVFVSHTWVHEDKRFSDALVAALKEKGLDIWYDEESLGIGDSLPDKIQIYQFPVLENLYKIEQAAWAFQAGQRAKALQRYLEGFVGLASDPGYGRGRYKEQFPYLTEQIEKLPADEAKTWCQAFIDVWETTPVPGKKDTTLAQDILPDLVVWCRHHIRKLEAA